MPDLNKPHPNFEENRNENQSAPETPQGADPISQEQYHRELAQAHEFIKKSAGSQTAIPAATPEAAAPTAGQERPISGLSKGRFLGLTTDPITGQAVEVCAIQDDEFGEPQKQNIPPASEDTSAQEHTSDEIRESRSKVGALLKELLWCLNAQSEAARKNKQSFFDQQQIAGVILDYERLARQNGFPPGELFSPAEQFRLWSGASSELGESPTALAIRVARIEKELSTSLGQLESFREAERNQTKAAKPAPTAANLNPEDTPVPDESSKVAVQTAATPMGTSTEPTKPLVLEKLPEKKHDYSKWFDPAGLTNRQHQCASLLLEYELPIAQIARRLGITRKTVDGHLARANKKINEVKSRDARAKSRAQSGTL